MSLLASGLLWLGLASAPAGPADAYVSQVERYRRGDPEGALRGLLQLDDVELQRGAERTRGWVERGQGGSFSVEAALMLHTEAALLARRGSSMVRFEAELAQAQAWGELLERHPERIDFARRWRLALGSQLMGWRDVRARRLFEEGLRLSPRDPALHLAVGETAEAQAAFLEERQLERQRQAQLGEAESHYRQALAGDPVLEEARLHLGRVLMESGRAGEAQALLQGLTATSRSSGVLYLAQLFLGRIHQDAGRLDEAARSYRQAVALDPRSQAANLALGQALEALGLADEAAEAWRRAASGSERNAPDAWWYYAFGESHRSGALLELLRVEAAR